MIYFPTEVWRDVFQLLDKRTLGNCVSLVDTRLRMIAEKRKWMLGSLALRYKDKEEGLSGTEVVLAREGEHDDTKAMALPIDITVPEKCVGFHNLTISALNCQVFDLLNGNFRAMLDRGIHFCVWDHPHRMLEMVLPPLLRAIGTANVRTMYLWGVDTFDFLHNNHIFDFDTPKLLHIGGRTIERIPSFEGLVTWLRTPNEQKRRKQLAITFSILCSTVTDNVNALIGHIQKEFLDATTPSPFFVRVHFEQYSTDTVLPAEFSLDNAQTGERLSLTHVKSKSKKSGIKEENVVLKRILQTAVGLEWPKLAERELLQWDRFKQKPAVRLLIKHMGITKVKNIIHVLEASADGDDMAGPSSSKRMRKH